MRSVYHRVLAVGFLGLGASIAVGCVGETLPDGSAFDEAELYNVETYRGDLKSNTGNLVASGSTCSLANDFTPNCANSNAPDASYLWKAPVSGSYTFNTFGSTFDTVLHLRPYNNSTQVLMCNDDANGTLQSSLTRYMAAGETVFIVVDGYGTSCGQYKLNITTSACVSGCCINGQNYQNGQLNPSNQCQICDTSKSTTSWSNNDGYWIQAGGGGYCKYNECLAAACAGGSSSFCSTHGSSCDGVCSGGVVVTACDEGLDP